MRRGLYRQKRCLRTRTGSGLGQGESHTAHPEDAACLSEKSGFLRNGIGVFRVAQPLALGLSDLIEQTHSRGRVRMDRPWRTRLKRAVKRQTGKRIERLRNPN